MKRVSKKISIMNTDEEFYDLNIYENLQRPIEINYGLKLDQETKNAIEENIFELKSKLPDGALFKARILKNENGYKIYLVFTFGEKTIFATEMSKKAKLALEHLVQDVKIKIQNLQTEQQNSNENLHSLSFVKDEQKSLPPPSGSLKVLIVDDDPLSTLLIGRTFESNGCEIKLIDDTQLAIDAISHDDYDLLILDWDLGRMNGKKVLEESSKIVDEEKRKINVPVVSFSGVKEGDIALESMEHFDYLGYLSKKLDRNELDKKSKFIIDALKQNHIKL